LKVLSKVWPSLSIALGAFFVYWAHDGILSGSIQEPPPRYQSLFFPDWTPGYVTLTDPYFWTYASCFYAVGLVFLVFGVIYFTTGDRYLPPLKSNGWFGYILCFIALISWAGLNKLLPIIYA